MILKCDEFAAKKLKEVKQTVAKWEADGMDRAPGLVLPP